MADGAPACECREPDNDDVMIACSRSHAKCETAKCGGALWFHLHCVGCMKHRPVALLRVRDRRGGREAEEGGGEAKEAGREGVPRG
eukprot:COSAG06_NODE_1047_length_10974_cov_4.227218_5_plen_86_part_00